MTKAAAGELNRELVAAGVLEEGAWEEAAKRVVGERGTVTEEHVFEELVSAGMLTNFQGEMLKSGQAKGLCVGEYTLLDLLGAGGMGRVFRALHRRMDREVALKVLPERLVANPDAVKRFEREVRMAARLHHANVVTAFDAGEHEGLYYLVMEYVPGADLAAVVKALGPLPLSDALRATIQAADGLCYAHGEKASSIGISSRVIYCLTAVGSSRCSIWDWRGCAPRLLTHRIV